MNRHGCGTVHVCAKGAFEGAEGAIQSYGFFDSTKSSLSFVCVD